jgi:heme/copper-type cytochrome/quinol oxidase subunit 3
VSAGNDATLFEHLDWDHSRGTWGMVLFIVTEAMLFASLFFAYYLLGRGAPQWPPEDLAPGFKFSAWMTLVLVASSFVLEWGNRLAKRDRTSTARAAVFATVLLGAAFLVLQFFEYKDRLKHVAPTDGAYGSIFYTMTTLHATHLFLGMLMLSYVLLLPMLEKSDRPPHRPLHNAALYWHFVDVVWIFIIVLIYVVPNVVKP